MIVPLILNGQARHKQGEIVGDADNVVVDSVDKVGTVLVNYVAGAAINSYNDSIKILEGIQDSMRIVWLRLWPEDDIVDVTAPLLLSGSVSALKPNIVTLSYDENLDSSQTATIKGALAYDDGASVTIDSVGINNSSILVYTDSIYADSTLTMTYTLPGSGGIQDSSGNRSLAFTDYSITNNVVGSVFMDKIHYLFENNMTDQAGNYNAIVVTAPTYESHTPDPFEGVYSAYFGSAAAQEVYIPATYDLPNRFSIAFAFHYNGTTPNFVLTNIHQTFENGYNINIDDVNHRVVFQVEGAGVSSWTYAYSTNNSITENAWNYVVVSCVNSTGATKIFVDGVDVTSDGTVEAGFDLDGDDGTIRIGYTAYGNFDDLRIIGDTISETEALRIFNNPGEDFYRTGSTDPTPDETAFTTYADSIGGCNFNSSGLGPYYIEEIRSDFGGYGRYSNGLNNPYNCEIIDLGGGDYTFKCTNPANSVGADAGFQFFANVDYGGDEIYMSYNLYMGPTYESYGTLPGAVGGKIPGGFAADDYTTAGVPYNPLTHNGYWWTNMWKQDEALDFYLSWPDQSGNYAEHSPFGRWDDSDGTQFELLPETWYNITLRMVLNDVGDNNGLIEAFINGILAASWTSLELRLSPSAGIDFAVLDFFYGGTIEFAAPVDVWMYMDDVYIFNYRSDYPVAARGHTPSPTGRDISSILPDPDNKW